MSAVPAARRDGLMFALFGAVAAAGVGAAVALGQLFVLAALAGVVVFLLAGPQFRLAVLLAMLAGNAAYWLRLPTGSYAGLIALAMAVDVLRKRDGPVSPATTAWWAVCCVLTLALSPSRFGVALVGGLTLFVYIQATTRDRIPPAAMVAVAAAGAANAIWSITHPGLNYVLFTGGTSVQVTRGVGVGLDPNASAVLLLLGAGASCWGLLRLRGPIRFACGAAALTCTAGVASTGSRGATIGVGLIVIGTAVAALRSRAHVPRLLAVVAIGLAGLLPYIAYRVFLDNNALYRFSLVSAATRQRGEIYRAWLDAWLHDLPSFLFGVSRNDFSGSVPTIPPHNSFLELASQVGLVGCLAIAILVLTSRPRRPRHGAELTTTALALLLVALLIGLSAGYTPWVALALLVRRRPERAREARAARRTAPRSTPRTALVGAGARGGSS